MIFMALGGTLRAQADHRLGLLPQINLSKKIGKGWKINGKIEDRESLRMLDEQGAIDRRLSHLLTDASLVVVRQSGAGPSAGAGYLLRLRDGAENHRFMQLISWVQPYDAVRVGHRAMIDETFASNEQTKIRVRYRLGVELPLQGQVLDPKELYFKLTNEYLNVFQGDSYDLVIRLTPYVGYVFGDNNKVELGVEGRFDNFVRERLEKAYWIRTTWYIAL